MEVLLTVAKISGARHVEWRGTCSKPAFLSHVAKVMTERRFAMIGEKAEHVRNSIYRMRDVF